MRDTRDANRTITRNRHALLLQPCLMNPTWPWDSDFDVIAGNCANRCWLESSSSSNGKHSSVPQCHPVGLVSIKSRDISGQNRPPGVLLLKRRFTQRCHLCEMISLTFTYSKEFIWV